MNHRFFRLALLAALPAATFSFAPQAQAQTARRPAASCKASAPRTVSDYFLLLPESYFGEFGRPDTAQEALDQAAVRDDANDYIELQNDSGATLLVVTIFRHQGRVLVAVNLHNKHTDYIEVLRWKNGSYQEVTEDVIPGFDADASVPDKKLYVLPRRGTTIRVYQAAGKNEDAHGRHLYDLAWRGGKFIIKR